ncbi:hypothetical protein BD413DRAFT_611678 [Trametes elegans]|nr:hypothetical protein BD413DRAFT_611678 [Trametes elegans]
MIEHRFFGLSDPYPNLSLKSPKLLTVQEAIDDFECFEKNVNLPMPRSVAINPGLFQVGYASSAVVESIVDFWRYFQPIIEYMPKNCSADVQAVVKHVDAAYKSGGKQEMERLDGAAYTFY